MATARAGNYMGFDKRAKKERAERRKRAAVAAGDDERKTESRYIQPRTRRTVTRDLSIPPPPSPSSNGSEGYYQPPSPSSIGTHSFPTASESGNIPFPRYSNEGLQITNGKITNNTENDFARNVANGLNSIYQLVQNYGKDNKSFKSPYVSILQYETKLNILKQTMIQLRQSYEKQYDLLENSRGNKALKHATALKQIASDYRKIVLQYILHEQLIQKFWEDVSKGNSKEKGYANYMLQTYAGWTKNGNNEELKPPANNAAKLQKQKNYAKLYANAIQQKLMSDNIYENVSRENVGDFGDFGDNYGYQIGN